MTYGQHFVQETPVPLTVGTPQSQPIPGSAQVANSAGGYSFAVDHWKRLDRFLILGSEGGSYYAGERELTLGNADAVVRCIQEDGPRAVARIVEVSEAGRTPKNVAALLALAIAAKRGDDRTRAAAYAALSSVARIGTHLFHFVDFCQKFGGWGRGLRNAVGRWFTGRDADDLAYQLCKYAQRDGWSQRDLLRLAHPKAPSAAHDALFKWVVRDEVTSEAPELIRAFVAVKAAKSEGDVLCLLAANPRITWEMLPSEHLGSPRVWEELLPRLPLNALIRNLGRMSANGLLKPMSDAARIVTRRLSDGDALRKARIHPIAALSALITYQNGHGARGQLSWIPATEVVDALDGAFYSSFANVEPAGKRFLLALDVSGSMEGGEVAGVPGLTPRVASAAMAMATARTEPAYRTVAFTSSNDAWYGHRRDRSFEDGLTELAISPRQRLDDVLATVSGIPFGRTDCSLPILWALEHRVEVDAFVVYTDSETWAGVIHPAEALRRYRDAMGIAAKLVVVGMVSNGFTIADPDDAGMLDVVGFDTSAPALISGFSRD